MSDPKPLLQEAQELIDGDRQADYGDPHTCHRRIAAYWSMWLEDKLRTPLTPIDVAAMMDLLKTARAQANPEKRDNWLDKAGYVGLLVDKLLGKKR
jgi:hypothetical protein